MKKGDLLFVYGTLRPGESADMTKMAGAKHLGSDAINGELFDLGWYPGAKAEPSHFDTGAPSIKGDVFELTDESIIPRLDSYEGYPNLYDRIQTHTAQERCVWVYTFNHGVTDNQKIASGDWLGIVLAEGLFPIAG
jgi:gamma-glutamylcyclotransferase (GGCT)/AIG2-like uncharacterized protein YtfP